MGEDLVADARRAVSRNAWRDAVTCYARADQQGVLTAEDLSEWAQAAYLTGEGAVAESAWSRAYQAWAAGAAIERAVRCAFWLGLTLVLAGEHAKGGGWFARAGHLAAGAAPGAIGAELRLPEALADLRSGRAEAARQVCAQLAAGADADGDPDLATLARLGLGQAQLALGEVRAGLADLDEAMLAVVAGDVAPLVAGIVYCAVILACRDTFDVPRAQQWTTALSDWCDRQQGIRPYRGQCLVHRSELLQLRGQWPEALTAAQEARSHLAGLPGDPAQGMACYQLGELLRLRGEDERADAAYREAGAWGHPVQPGLALLRLAQGQPVAAARALTAALAVTTDHAGRLRLLAAAVQVTLAADDVTAARRHLDELDRLASGSDSDFLRATADQATGRVLLAEGHPEAAARALYRAKGAWLELRAPAEAGAACLELGEAYLALGDPEAARLEQTAGTAQLAAVGAHPPPGGHPPGTDRGGGVLTARQLEVLTQVAAGATNRQIARALSISEHTVRRHLQNIFAALEVRSRAAATAWAYRQGLLRGD